MKKKLFKYTASIIAACGIFLAITSGCSEDLFNEKAGDRITPDQHYSSLEDIAVSMRGAIVPLQDILPKLIILDGLRSDQMEITPNADMNLVNIYHHQFYHGNPFTNPADLYKVIININEVLANLHKVQDRRFDEVSAPQIEGALIGMRAWTYLTIARLYGKAAYIENNMTSLPSDFTKNMLSKDALIDTLINQVKPYIHDATQTQFEELRFDHYVNNKAVLGELYLEKNDYANAVTYLKLACESYLNQPSLFKVDRSYQNAAWSSIFLNAGSQVLENIAVMPYSSRENQNNPLADYMLYSYWVKPSTVLVDSFMAQLPAAGDPGDPWRGHGVTFRLDTIAQLGEEEYLTEATIIKYAQDVTDAYGSDIIMSRASDIHLLLAEAYNRLGDRVSQDYALMLLNDGANSVNPKPAPFIRWANNLGIRGRVYLRAKQVPEGLRDETLTRYIEDLIIAERALELAFEGRRWTDLVRVAERRNDPSYLADRVAAKFEGTPQYDMIRNKLMDPTNWYLPKE